MEFKYKPGDTAYVCPRQGGVLKVTIKSCVNWMDIPAYELEEEFIYHKDGHKLGSREEMEIEEEDGPFMPGSKYRVQPCPEHVLFQPGEPKVSTHPMFFGDKNEEDIFHPVVINKIEEPTVSLFTPNGVLVGEITSDLQLNDVRLQIKRQNLEGYYIEYEEEKILISSSGRLKGRKGLYDLMDKQLEELLGF